MLPKKSFSPSKARWLNVVLGTAEDSKELFDQAILLFHLHVCMFMACISKNVFIQYPDISALTVKVNNVQHSISCQCLNENETRSFFDISFVTRYFQIKE